MNARRFMEKLLDQVSLEDIDFACDLERVLAEEVKYLRKVINAYAEEESLERDGLICELRARIADKDAQIARLIEENRFLTEQPRSS